MKITQEQVHHVAALANLSLTEAEVSKLQGDLDAILVYFDKLNEIDFSGVEPMAQVLYNTEETESLRPDILAPPLGNELALANAPQAGAGYFKVPKVIDR